MSYVYLQILYENKIRLIFYNRNRWMFSRFSVEYILEEANKHNATIEKSFDKKLYHLSEIKWNQ